MARKGGRTIIVQRVVPHYRAPLFKMLHDRLSWSTVAASNPPGNTFLNTEGGAAPHLKYYPFDFPDPRNQYACRVPLDRIVEDLEPERVISEFGWRMSTWRDLPLMRARGRIRSYALWSHGWNMERGFDHPRDWPGQYARLAPLALADLLMTYSEEGKAWLDKWLPWKKVISIGNTLDTEEIERASAGVVPVRHGSPQLLAVGRLTAEKNFDRLIPMFQRVKKRLPGAALTIIGDGPERSALETLVRSSGAEGIQLPGAIYSEKALAPHFKGADLFVLTGAAGLSVNHALAYGLPVIAFGRGRGLPLHHPEIEYIVDGVTGLLCHDPDLDAMADLIVTAHRSGMADQLRNKIPGFVAEKLRLDSMVRRFAMVDELL